MVSYTKSREYIDMQIYEQTHIRANNAYRYNIYFILSRSTGWKLNVHKIFRRRPGRLLNAL